MTQAPVSAARRIIHALRAALIIGAFTLILAELALRVYNHYFPVYIFYTDSYERFRGKPFSPSWGDFKLNSKGFKDLEFAPKKEGIYRILALGDSFAYGITPYRYNYLTLLEDKLKQSNPSIEVFNMGIPSTGPGEQLALLAKEGLALQPDAVLLSFFIGNDFVDSDKSRAWFHYSYVASFFYYILFVHEQHEGVVRQISAEYCDECPSFDEQTYLQVEYDRSLVFIKQHPYYLSAFKQALNYLQDIQTLCKKNNIRLIVTLIPDEFQLNPVITEKVKAAMRRDWSVTEEQWDLTQPNKDLGKSLERMGLPLIDLYPEFSAAGKNLYKPYDSHWNIAGNTLAAEILARELRAGLLVPQQ